MPSVIVLVVILVLRLNPFSKIVKPLLRRIQSMLYGHDDRSVPFQQTADLVEKLRAQKNVVFEEPIRDFKNPGREAEMPSDVTM